MRTESAVIDSQRTAGSVPFDQTAANLATIEGRVRDVVRQMGDEEVHYVYNDWTQANIDLDKVPTPCIVFVQPASGAFDIKNGKAYDSPQCALAFLDRSGHDDDATGENCVVERMKRLALRFLWFLNKSGYFEPIVGTVNYQVPIDTLDSVVSGCVITPTLRERPNYAMCFDQLRR